MKIYLAGLVPKGDEDGKSFSDWRVHFTSHLKKLIKADFIDPRDREEDDFDESDFEKVFALDCKRIKECDLLIVNGDKLGVGGAQEILIAKYFKKPVILVLPKDTIHRRKDISFKGQLIGDWIHPFLYSTCDLLVDDVKNLTKKQFDSVINSRPKDLGLIDKAILSIKKPS